MRKLIYLLIIMTLASCANETEDKVNKENPFFVELNKPVDYSKVTAVHIKEYANKTVKDVEKKTSSIKTTEKASFENIFTAMDDIINSITIASNNCFMLYWVSPDSLSREEGFLGYQILDSLSTSLYSDKEIYSQMIKVKESEEYLNISDIQKRLVDDLIMDFKRSGVNLEGEKLETFIRLSKEIN